MLRCLHIQSSTYYVRRFTTLHFGELHTKISHKPASVGELREHVRKWLMLDDPQKMQIYNFKSISGGNFEKDPILSDNDSIDAVGSHTRVELLVNAQVKSHFNIHKIMKLLVPGVTNAADFSYALRRNSLKHRWDSVKYVLPDKETETIKITPDGNGIAMHPKYLLTTINNGGTFLLVLQRSNYWRLICLGAIAFVFHFILALYLYYF
jgi:hypothetical protein